MYKIVSIRVFVIVGALVKEVVVLF